MRLRLGYGLLAISCILFFVNGTHIDGDGEVRYQAIQTLLHSGHLEAMKYSFLGPLFSTPLLLLDQLLGTGHKIASCFNALLFILVLLMWRRVLKNHLSEKTILSFLLILSCFSMYPAHLQHFYAEVFSSLAIALGFVLFETQKPKTGGALLIFGAINTPSLIFPLGFVFGFKFLKTRNLKLAIIPALAVAGVLLENFLKRGSITASGYDGDGGFKTAMPYSGMSGFSYPLFLGLLSILFSFGKGLVFFTPASFLPVRNWMKDNPVLNLIYRDWLWFLIGTILIYSKWWSWYGGWFWGPRFFLFSSILSSLVLAVAIERANTSRARIFIGALLAWSAWVGFEGASFGQADLFSVCGANQYSLESLCWYAPEFSPLFRPWIIGGWTLQNIIEGLFYLGVFVYLVRGWAWVKSQSEHRPPN